MLKKPVDFSHSGTRPAKLSEPPAPASRYPARERARRTQYSLIPGLTSPVGIYFFLENLGGTKMKVSITSSPNDICRAVNAQSGRS
ncbi:MAG: hypothetical protein A4E63_02045 [Syntrophorhabdus sp. PtaU1.Bin050]|nr:MAG: hypothetical protein A4E63_02045 [Syntrophorhabdus sp. PtaU1.Bin050]